MNVGKILKPWVVTYKPELLIACGISGFIATSVLNVAATAKAVRAIDAEKNRLGRNLSNKEIVKLCWKHYIPSVVTACVSIPCIIIGNNINNKRNAALAAAYTVAETSLQTFKEETAKSLGEDKVKEIEEKVSQKKVDKTYDSSAVVLSGDGDTLFCDEYSGRYFKSNWSKIQRIANELNAAALGGSNTITLSDWYSELGLDTTTNSDNLGWDVFDGTRGLIKISLDSCITPDKQPCGVIHYINEPKVLFA